MNKEELLKLIEEIQKASKNCRARAHASKDILFLDLSIALQALSIYILEKETK